MMPSIRAVVVDDEPPARARMRRLLDAHADVVVVGEASTGEEALTQVLGLRPDVVFLDVRMPGVSGTEVAERLMAYLPEGVRPAVVFTTAHAEHAVEAFAVQGLDYLLKPVEAQRLAEALRRLRQRIWARHPSHPVTPPAVAAPPPQVLIGYHGASEAPVPVEEVVLVDMDDGVAFATTQDGRRVRLGDGLAEIEAALPCPPFARVSRSSVVHVGRVERMTPTGAGTFEAVLEGGYRVAVSRRRAKHLRELMGLD